MPDAQVVVQTPKYGSGSAAALRQERIPARLGAEASQGLGWDEGGRYLSQTWASGTVCDKTGLPREVEVQVRAAVYSWQVSTTPDGARHSPVPLQHAVDGSDRLDTGDIE